MSYYREPGAAIPYSTVRLANSYPSLPSCGSIKTGTFSIWLSFNDGKPYYIVHEETKDLRVTLLSVRNNVATFVVKTPRQQIAMEQLAPDQSLTFTWNNCRCRLTYLGGRHLQTSFRYLWRARETAEYKLEVIQ